MNWWDELRRVSETSSRDRHKELVRLQRRIKEECIGLEQTTLLASISAEFDKLQSERQAFRDNSEHHYERIQEDIRGLRDQLYFANKYELNDIFDDYKLLQKEVNTAGFLISDHKKALRGTLQEDIFEVYQTKKKEIITTLNQEDKEFREENKKTLFSELDFLVYHIDKEMDLPKQKREEISLEPVLASYNKLFNFKNSHKKGEFRRQQAQFIITAYEGMSTQTPVVLEGPTGLGKTRALLAAITPFLEENSDHKVIYSTRTLSQVFNVINEIREIQEADGWGDIRASINIGVSRLRDEFTHCYQKSHDWNEKNRQREEKGRKAFKTTRCNWGCSGFPYRHGEQQRDQKHPVTGLEELIEEKMYCPSGVMQQAAEHANLVIAPHSYLGDEEWKARISPDKNLTAIIIDEGHNFINDAGTSPFLTLSTNAGSFDSGENRISNEYTIRQFVKQIQEKNKRHDKNYHVEIDGEYLRVDHMLSYLNNMFDELESIIEGFIEEHEIKEPVIATGKLFELYQNIPEAFKENLLDYKETLLEMAEEVANDSRAGINVGSVYSAYQIVDRLARALEDPYEFALNVYEDTFQFYPIHPKESVDKTLEGYRNVVLTSATLSPPEDVAYLAGFNHAISAKIPQIFPAKNYKHFFVTGVNSSRKEDLEEKVFTQNEEKILMNTLTKAQEAAEGRNIGIFCNSNNSVEEIYHLIKDSPGIVLGYIGGDKHEEVSEALERNFKITIEEHRRSIFQTVPEALYESLQFGEEYNIENVIRLYKALGYSKMTTSLLGVSGGSLSEGVDYPDKQMEMVISVGLPYPSNAAEIAFNKVKEQYFYMQKGDKGLGEDLAYKQDAFRKVAQTIGRSHRRLTDKGVILFLDERLLGIKNVRANGSGRYEYLSMANARKNIKLLPEPVQKFNNNIVIGGFDHKENEQLKNYMSRGITGRNNFITPEKMAQEIRAFYD